MIPGIKEAYDLFHSTLNKLGLGLGLHHVDAIPNYVVRNSYTIWTEDDVDDLTPTDEELDVLVMFDKRWEDELDLIIVGEEDACDQ